LGIVLFMTFISSSPCEALGLLFQIKQDIVVVAGHIVTKTT